MTAPKPKKGNLGDPVTYISSKGKSKLAFVIGTPDSIDDGGSIPALDDGYRHLLIISPSGRFQTRHSVPNKADTASDEFKTQNPDFDAANPVNIWF